MFVSMLLIAITVVSVIGTTDVDQLPKKFPVVHEVESTNNIQGVGDAPEVILLSEIEQNSDRLYQGDDVLVAGTIDNEVNSSITSNSSGTLFLTYENVGTTNPGIYLYESTNGGDSWTPVLMIAAANLTNPSLALGEGTQNWLFLTFVMNGVSLYVFRFNVSNPLYDNDNPVNYYNGLGVANPKIITDSVEYSSNWYPYLIFNERVYNKQDLWQLSFIRSVDYGATWGSIQILNFYENFDPYYDGRYAHPDIGYGSNNLFVVYDDYDYSEDDDERDVFVRYSSDFGATWSGEQKVADNEFNHECDPSVAVVKGLSSEKTILITYTSVYSMTDNDIFYAYSQDGGMTWNKYCALDVSYSNDTLSDVTTSDNLGFIQVVYLKDADIIYRRVSYLTPEIWTNEMIVNEEHSAALGHTPRIAVNPTRPVNEEAAITWTDCRNSGFANDVYFDTNPRTNTYFVELVKDINPGAVGSYPYWSIVFNNNLIFGASDATHGRELWITDGTTAGTILLKDINPGSGSSDSDGYRFIEFNNKVYFCANDGVHGGEMWVTDGTVAGTLLLKDINPGSGSSDIEGYQFIEFDNQILFQANDGIHGRELWVTDGTAIGTTMVTDLNVGPDSSEPAYFIKYKEKVFFSADDGTRGREVWMTDGTALGTTLVKDINTNAGSEPSQFIEHNNLLFFSAYEDIYGQELWITDGTEYGTTMVMDINTIGDSEPTNFYVFGYWIFFRATDGYFGYELWRSDGTEVGTTIVKDINPGSASSYPQVFINYDNRLFFNAIGTSGQELWVTDGTTDGTQLFMDINPGPGSSSPFSFIIFDNTLFFTAVDGIHGNELWMTDGTEVGTSMVEDINPGANSSWPSGYIEFNDTLIFGANESTFGKELWSLMSLVCIFGSPSPANGATKIARPPPQLQITVSDLDNDLLDISFYWKNHMDQWILLQTHTGVGNGTYTFFPPITSDWIWGNTTYTWSVNVTDGINWRNKIYQYTTGGNRYDVNNNGIVNFQDAGIVWTHRTSIAPYDGLYDVNQDGQVNFMDAGLTWVNRD